MSKIVELQMEKERLIASYKAKLKLVAKWFKKQPEYDETAKLTPDMVIDFYKAVAKSRSLKAYELKNNLISSSSSTLEKRRIEVAYAVYCAFLEKEEAITEAEIIAGSKLVINPSGVISKTEIDILKGYKTQVEKAANNAEKTIEPIVSGKDSSGIRVKKYGKKIAEVFGKSAESISIDEVQKGFTRPELIHQIKPKEIQKQSSFFSNNTETSRQGFSDGLGVFSTTSFGQAAKSDKFSTTKFGQTKGFGAKTEEIFTLGNLQSVEQKSDSEKKSIIYTGKPVGEILAESIIELPEEIVEKTHREYSSGAINTSSVIQAANSYKRGIEQLSKALKLSLDNTSESESGM